MKTQEIIDAEDRGVIKGLMIALSVVGVIAGTVFALIAVLSKLFRFEADELLEEEKPIEVHFPDRELKEKEEQDEDIIKEEEPKIEVEMIKATPRKRTVKKKTETQK